jgi:hypothetical protein
MKRVAAKFVLRLLIDERGGRGEKKRCVWMLAAICRKSSSIIFSFSQSWNRWWELVLLLWLWVKAAVNLVEGAKFAQTKKSAASSLNCQDNAGIFSRCWWDSAQGVCSSRTHSKSVLLGCAERTAWVPVTRMSRKVADWGLVLAPW